MLRLIVFSICGLAATAGVTPSWAEVPVTTRPVLQTGVPHPTRDKPQSKLWYAHGHWWAWLPTVGGSCIWKRTREGWRPESAVTHALRGVTGRADVWSDDAGVRAVVADSHKLTVVELRYESDRQTYRVVRLDKPLPNADATSDDAIETATIARDALGRYWIAYDRHTQTWVQHLPADDPATWSTPQSLGEPTKPDDLCAIVALPDGVGVMWTNQQADAVYFARRRDDDALSQWRPIETVARGGRTADDHLHVVVRRDGTLLAATKNSVDRIGEPQLVLRIRRPDGQWESRPYAPLAAESMPSRPIVLLGGTAERPLLLHSVYTPKKSGRPSFIAEWTINAATLDPRGPDREIIQAATSLNNVTGCKQSLPDGVPWIVLAGDAAGAVYEAELSTP